MPVVMLAALDRSCAALKEGLDAFGKRPDRGVGGVVVSGDG